MQEEDGEATLALRYGWLIRDIVDLSALDRPAIAPRLPRQIFWQKDKCADGGCHVSGRQSPSLPCVEIISASWQC